MSIGPLKLKFQSPINILSGYLYPKNVKQHMEQWSHGNIGEAEEELFIHV